LKVQRYQPRILAVLGVGAYRSAFARPKAVIGEQDEVPGSARVGEGQNCGQVCEIHWLANL